MKARPLKLQGHTYTPCEPDEATHIALNLPGPLPNRILPVIQHGPRTGTPCWTWNGSIDAPTVKPSVLSRGGDAKGDHVCHSFINNGQVQFLADCSHEFAGQTLDLLDVELF
jgi:hypothetical protein